MQQRPNFQHFNQNGLDLGLNEHRMHAALLEIQA